MDPRVPVPEEMSREELIVLVRRQAGQIAELMEANGALAAKLARVEHLLSRNSGNSSSPPSKDDDPGKTPPVEKKRGRVGPARPKGKQPGAPGSHLGWTENPDEHRDRFPEGRCDCGDDLAAARDLGSSTATSPTRSRRSACGSPSTTSTRWCAGAGRCTPPTGLRGPGLVRSGTARTWRPSRCI